MSPAIAWIKAAVMAAVALALLASCLTIERGALERLDSATLRDARSVIDPVGADLADDAGDASFVRQAVPIVLGRKVRGHDELKLFVGLVQQTDRARFLRILTNRRSPFHAEYLEHWSSFFVDRMRVHRETERDLRTCFTPRRSGAPGPGLAGCIAANGPDIDCRASAGAFSMGDVLRSAIVADNLEPAYRAYLFPMVSAPANGADATTLNRRDSIGETFAHVFVHRNLGCLGCHTTPHSVSGELDINNHASFWNRHHPVPGAFELALYGADSGRDRNEVHAPLRPPGDLGGSGTRPWQMSDCAGFPARTAIPVDTAVNLSGSTFEGFLTRNLGRQSSVWDLEETLRAGAALLQTSGLRRDRLLAAVAPSCTDHCAGVASPPAIPEPPVAVRNFIGTCGGACHAAGSFTGLELHDAAPTPPSDWLARVVSEPARSGRCTGFPYLVVPGQPELSCLNHLVATDQMPPGGATQNQKNDLRAWITSLPAGAGCDPAEPSVCTPSDNDNPAALAYLTAINIVDQVWEEAMGSRLTIANYFPRNPHSRNVLQNLTETVFVPGGWSLRELLIKILTSQQFNRRSADTTALGSAYVQQPIAKPFEVNDPRFPPESLAGWVPGSPRPTPDFMHLFTHMRDEAGRSRHRNSVGDGIYRYSAQNLLRSTHRALGWPAGDHVAGGAAYPADSLRKAIGQFFQDAEPGFRGVGFQTLLRWEGDHGLCRNRNSTGADWIGEAIARLQAPPPGVVYTRGDVAVLIRDWLIGDGAVSTTVPAGQASSEHALLAALYGDLALPADVSTAAARMALENQMRSHCGALLMSPQFLLAGIAPEALGPRPALRACLPGEPCDFRQICIAMEPAVRGGLGLPAGPVISTPVDPLRYRCTDTTVELEIRTIELERADWACPRAFCQVIAGGPQLQACLKDPSACMPSRPPACRPGCASVDCCGGPLPPVDAPRYSLVWLEGAIVERARGVTLYRRDDFAGPPRALPLEAGTRLSTGDWLQVPPGAELRIAGAGSVLQTPGAGVLKQGESPVVFLQVSGPEALQSIDPDRLVAPVPRASIWQSTLFPKSPDHEHRERVRLQGRTAPRSTLEGPRARSSGAGDQEPK